MWIKLPVRSWAAVLSLALLLPAGVSRADDPVANPPVAITDEAEKAKILDLIKLMWKMQREAAPNETLADALNPPGQGGTQGGYEPTKRRPPFADGPTKITEALRHYAEMLRNGKLKKDPCKWGASAKMEPGIKDDVVTLSGKFLAIWCDMAATPQARAAAKFQTMASLANELAHVYQIEPAALTAAQWDPLRCNHERDSDCMSIKFLEYTIALMKNATNTPHASLAAIEAEGRAGECLAKCLMMLGVDTAAELTDVVTDLRAKLAHYTDRKMNLFENQINQTLSWRELYYGGKYKSPLRLKVDTTMLAGMRVLKVMYGNGAVVELVVPNDGKTPINYIVTVNKMGQLVVIVITWGADGSICYHVWTDTNFDGVPDGAPVSVSIPAPVFPGDIVPAQHQAWLLHAPISALSYNDPLLLHDRRNGSLTMFDMNNAGVPTGAYRVLLRSSLIADPLAAGPSAGGFHTLYDIDEISFPGQMRAIFLSQGETSTSNSAVVGIHTVASNTWTFQGPMTPAAAQAPMNEPGVAHLPYFPDGLTLLANPGNAVQVLSAGQGAPVLVTFGTINSTGRNNVGLPPIQSGPDMYLVSNGLQTVQYAQARFGALIGVLDHPVVGGPAPDVLVLSDFPGRLAVFGSDPAPAFQLAAEIVTEDAMPGVLERPSPIAPAQLGNYAGDVVLRPVAGSPLIAQTLIDLDGDGLADDAAVVARLPEFPQNRVFAVFDAASPMPTWFPTLALPFEPAGIFYININGDNQQDIRIEDALGGPPLCLQSQGMGGFIPVACPAPCPPDFDGNGTLAVQDIFDFLNAWFAGCIGQPGPPCNGRNADFDGGGLAVSDIFAFLNAWFAGC